METPLFSVSDFIAITNQTLEFAYPSVAIEGEISSFKVNQGKYVFFDLKDASGSINCFMTVWQLRMPIEDGMKVIVQGIPKLTPWGKFSVTVHAIRPSGEGSLKKSFELLKAKLVNEGLFAPERKRVLPVHPRRVGVISSTQAAGYVDFIKIVNDRYGGLVIEVAHVQVQGTSAPDQIIRALRHFNEHDQPPEVIVIVRGGGSADDLGVFNDELLVREIAASRVPTLVGIGHEVDETLADMAADVRAATPSNAGQLLVPDRQDIIRHVWARVDGILPHVLYRIDHQIDLQHTKLRGCLNRIDTAASRLSEQLYGVRRILDELDPRRVLERGYALVRGSIAVGSEITVETKQCVIKAEVQHVGKK